jgi:hypothetical protein
MAEPRKVPIKIAASGFWKDATPYEAKGRYIDGDHIRFHDGQAQKIGGNVALNNSSNLFLGRCRSLLPYQDFSYNIWVITGTHIRLYQFDIDYALTNITPLAGSGQLTNPFSTTNLSTTVNVNDVSHTRVVGDYVNFANATAVGGITIDGEYQVQSIVDSNNYTITHSSAATSTAGPGGGTVDYEYELSAGNITVSLGGGYGIGPYGEGTYGTERASFTYLTFPRVWHLDKYGENILALPTGGTVYQWDPDTPTTRAVAVANAPTGESMFVTSERVVTVLGADGDLMLVKWCDDDDITLWTPADDNIANFRRLQDGNRLVGGGRLAQKVNLIWSDTALYLHQFTGQSNVYDTRHIATGCGLIGSKAWVVVDGVAYWWSSGAFKMFAGGQVLDIPRQDEIDQDVFDNLTDNLGPLVACWYNNEFNEVWWLYPRDGAEENSHYVTVNLNDFGWVTGTMARTAFAVKFSIMNTYYATDIDGYLYQHETGVNDNGAELNWSLETGLTDVDKGNMSMNVWGYIPDFKRQTGDVAMTLTAYDEPQASGATETKEITVEEGLTIEDFCMAGRMLKLTFEGSGVDCDIRFGNPSLEVSDAGELR